MKKPNFFIVGAPKCGTTALASYLKDHENIFMSTPKEPHFFANEFREWFYPCNSIEDYFKLFKESNDSDLAIGEASVLYLYSKNAIQKIKDYNPEAKIIVMLRSPIDIAYSWHSQGVFNMDETVKDFQKAWDLQSMRLKGENIPVNCRIPETLQYKEISKIGSQVEKLLNIFPRNQVHFIFLEEFKENTGQVYKEVLTFLNIDYDNKIVFPVINENKIHRSKSIAKIGKNKFVGYLRIIRNLFGLERFSPFKLLYLWNKKPVTRKPLSNSFKKELIIEFLPDIVKLEQLLNVNLEHWKILK